MTNDGWDLLIGDARPGFSQSYADGQTITTYHRCSDLGGVRPLVRSRSFHGAFPRYFEIDEEFRLYHDLAEDKNRNVLLTFDPSGREVVVVKVADREVSARLEYLRRFQAGTGLHLGLYVDSVRFSTLTLADVPAEHRQHGEVLTNKRWLRSINKCDFVPGYSTFSRLLCKAVLSPPPREQAGIWPFDSDTRDVAFIIGVDEEGRPLEHSSLPDGLANYFGANPEAPHYLAPVFFRREVLSKYFAEPDRYVVEDGQLTCLSLWRGMSRPLLKFGGGSVEILHDVGD